MPRGALPTKPQLQPFFNNNSIHTYICMYLLFLCTDVCLCVCLCTTLGAVPAEVSRGRWIPGNYSYRWLWVLGIEPGSSVSRCAIHLAKLLLCLGLTSSSWPEIRSFCPSPLPAFSRPPQKGVGCWGCGHCAGSRLAGHEGQAQEGQACEGQACRHTLQQVFPRCSRL